MHFSYKSKTPHYAKKHLVNLLFVADDMAIRRNRSSYERNGENVTTFGNAIAR